MALFDTMEEARERRRQRLEDQRIARENMTTGCVLIFIIPFILFFILNGVSAFLFMKTGNFASFVLGGFGLVLFIGSLIILCVKYGDIHKPRPGQYITGPDGRPVQVPYPEARPSTVSQPHQPRTSAHHTRGHRSHKHKSRAVDSHHRDQTHVGLMEGGGPTEPVTPPPSYSLVMGTGRHAPSANHDNRYHDTGTRLIDYGNV